MADVALLDSVFTLFCCAICCVEEPQPKYPLSSKEYPTDVVISPLKQAQNQTPENRTKR